MQKSQRRNVDLKPDCNGSGQTAKIAAVLIGAMIVQGRASAPIPMSNTTSRRETYGKHHSSHA